MRRAADELLQAGVEVVVAGCTEIPLALQDGDLPVPVIDVLDSLADAAIARAGGRRKRAQGSCLRAGRTGQRCGVASPRV